MADFVRATLTSGPDGFVPLAEEVRLQQIYLAVEQTRFGDRLGLTIDLPPEVRSVQVPALILQPLVENAVRHGVSQSEDKVLIAISATEMDGIVRIIVSDDARSEGSSPTPGMGLGLANVRQRLKLQYGDKGELRTRQLPSGGFEATISLPVSVHG
jgi:LytS/YehU family sensor histidine kinase